MASATLPGRLNETGSDNGSDRGVDATYLDLTPDDEGYATRHCTSYADSQLLTWTRRPNVRYWG